MRQNKLYLVSIALIFLALLLITTSTGMGQTDSDLRAYQQFNKVTSGPFARGELIYINEGKQLGTESYELSKTDSGEIKLTASGVVTPPIPIPFVKPKIKFDQTISASGELRPLSLNLQYKGPLGIGSKKIKISVSGERVKIDRGGKKDQITLNSANPFFAGTSSSQAIVALLLAKLERPKEMTEIISGGTGPGGGEEGQITRRIELKSVGTKTFRIGGEQILSQYFVFGESNSDVEKVIYVKSGSFIAYERSDADNTFYVYRSDLLGKDFEL